MTLYNHPFFAEQRDSSSYPSWVKCENYEACGDFIDEYAAGKNHPASSPVRKAALLVNALRRFGAAGNRKK